MRRRDAKDRPTGWNHHRDCGRDSGIRGRHRPNPPGPAPDPLLGTWALTVDGVYAGPVASVDGCSVTAAVIKEPPGPDRVTPKHGGAPVPAPCSIEVGLGMSSDFQQWLDGSLAGTEHPRDVQLVRVDTRAYALDMPHTAVVGVSLPKLDTASRAPAFLKLDLLPEVLRRRSVPRLPKDAFLNAPRPFTPAMLSAQLDDVRLDVTSVGPWQAVMEQAPATGLERDYARSPKPSEVDNLPLRAAEARIAPLDAWMQAQFVDGYVDERSLVLTLGDGRSALDLKLGHAGLAKGDLAPRADGSRAYALYAETATIASR